MASRTIPIAATSKSYVLYISHEHWLSQQSLQAKRKSPWPSIARTRLGQLC